MIKFTVIVVMLLDGRHYNTEKYTVETLTRCEERAKIETRRDSIYFNDVKHELRSEGRCKIIEQ